VTHTQGGTCPAAAALERRGRSLVAVTRRSRWKLAHRGHLRGWRGLDGEAGCQVIGDRRDGQTGARPARRDAGGAAHRASANLQSRTESRQAFVGKRARSSALRPRAAPLSTRMPGEANRDAGDTGGAAFLTAAMLEKGAHLNGRGRDRADREVFAQDVFAGAHSRSSPWIIFPACSSSRANS